MNMLFFVNCRAIHLKNVFRSTGRCEVLNSERILQCRSLLKENVNIWQDNVAPVVTHTLRAFINFIEKDDSHLYEASLTDDSNAQVALFVNLVYLVKRVSILKISILIIYHVVV